MTSYMVLDAVGRLVAAIWIPAAIRIVVWRYEKGIRSFLIDVSEFTFKGAGLEASFKRQQADAASALVAAAVKSTRVAADARAQNAWAAAAVVPRVLTQRSFGTPARPRSCGSTITPKQPA